MQICQVNATRNTPTAFAFQIEIGFKPLRIFQKRLNFMSNSGKHVGFVLRLYIIVCNYRGRINLINLPLEGFDPSPIMVLCSANIL